MNLAKYLTTISKDNCPLECPFKYNTEITPIILEPNHNNIRGIMISRDPTIKWYTAVYKNGEDPYREGIPGKLKNQIEVFIDDRIEDNEKASLYKTLFENVYWTHLHKCYTLPKNYVFSERNGKICANKWLSQEIKLVIEEYNIKFILALGKQVEDWIKQWIEENGYLIREIEVINLLHPSTQNNTIWHRTAIKMIEKAENDIKKLSEICNTIDG